ncbi:Seven in absentia protein family, partial [Musa troglodytarum]
MCSFFSPSPYDRSHGSPGGGGGQEASTWTLFRSPECMSLSVDAMDEEEVAPVRNSLKPPGAGDGAAGGGSGLPATQITSNSRVNELLECPVCTNTMYPPIHQLGMAPVYIVFLQFMGDENEAHNYRYSLEVGSNGRKLTWEGIPRSIRDSHQEVRDSHDGLIIQRNLAIFFSGNKKDLKLRVTGRIWKEEQNSDTGL